MWLRGIINDGNNLMVPAGASTAIPTCIWLFLVRELAAAVTMDTQSCPVLLKPLPFLKLRSLKRLLITLRYEFIFPRPSILFASVWERFSPEQHLERRGARYSSRYRCSEVWNEDTLGMFGGLGRPPGLKVEHVLFQPTWMENCFNLRRSIPASPSCPSRYTQ